MFLLCFSRGNTLTPYSKSVPAVIAKASAIYNPIIYAIIHPRYRYGKLIGMRITVCANMFFTMNKLPPFPQPHPMQCVLVPWPPHGGIRVFKPSTPSPCYRAAQTARGAPAVASGVGNSPSLHLTSPSQPSVVLWSCTAPRLMGGRCLGSSLLYQGWPLKSTLQVIDPNQWGSKITSSPILEAIYAYVWGLVFWTT